MTDEHPGIAESTHGTVQSEPSVAEATSEVPTADEPTATEPTATERLEAIRSRRRGRSSRGLLRALGYGVGSALLILVIGLALATVVIPRATGSTTLTVLTGSMRPKLPPGTLLIVKPKPIKDIRIGNVITYEPNPSDPRTVVTHRVVAITTGTDGSTVFTTKGDANNAVDPPVQAKQVVAVLWYDVPWMGWLASGVNGSNKGWIVIVLAVLLLGYAIWTVVGSRRKRTS